MMYDLDNEIPSFTVDLVAFSFLLLLQFPIAPIGVDVLSQTSDVGHDERVTTATRTT